MSDPDDYNDSGFKGEYMPGDWSTVVWAIGIGIAVIGFPFVLYFLFGAR